MTYTVTVTVTVVGLIAPADHPRYPNVLRL
jgi:hypothetical protein